MKLRALSAARRLSPIAILLAFWLAIPASDLYAQRRTKPYTLDQIEILIQGNVGPGRILELVRKDGLAFPMDETARARLQAVGAPPELLEGLSQVPQPAAVAVSTSQMDTATNPPPVDTSGSRGTRRYARADLARLYYADNQAIRFYGGPARLRWSGAAGSAAAAVVHESRTYDEVHLAPPTDVMASAGLSIGSALAGSTIELEAMTSVGSEEGNVLAILTGIGYEPFLPLGASHLRPIIGGRVSFLWASQQLGIQDAANGEFVYTDANRISVGVELGGRAGLAIHPSRRFHVFGDVEYRWGRALRSYLLEGENTGHMEDPWKASPLTYHGALIRIGFGL